MKATTIKHHIPSKLMAGILLLIIGVQAQNTPTPNLGLNRPPRNLKPWDVLINANFTLLDSKLACFGTSTVAGTIVYYNGSTWVCFAGNTSGTKVLQQTSAGVMSWVDQTAGTTGLGDPGTNGLIKRTALNTTVPAVSGTDYVPPADLTAGLALKLDISQKAAASGLASLDAGSKLVQNVDATKIVSGTIDTARLGSGVADAGHLLCGSSAWCTLNITHTPLLSAGDMIIANAAPALARLPIGADGHLMAISTSTHLPVWDAQLSNVGNVFTFTGQGGFAGKAMNLTAAIDAPTAIFHRYAPSQTANVLEVRALDESVLMSVSKTGAITASSFLTTDVNGGLDYTEGTGAAITCAAGHDILWPDSTAHRWKICNNGGTAANLVTSLDNTTSTNCTATGTAANPSVAGCVAAPAGGFSCATAATGATCRVNTTVVTADSEIIVQQNAYMGTRLGVTCNTTADAPTGPRVASIVAGASFTINVGTITTNPLCFAYRIVN